MKAKQAVVCPHCGALNRSSWQFCARCDQSLEGAQPEQPSPPDREAAGAEAPSSLSANLVAVAAVVALVVLGVAAWRYSGRLTAEGPSPELFKIASPAADLPSAPPPTGPGAADYEEGRRLMNAGDYAGAVARLGAAVAASPENADFQNVYGHALWRSGDRDGALVAHAAAAALDPKLQLQYARSLDVAGRGTEAARVYQEILARSPGATVAQADLGRLLYRGGDFAGAARHLEPASAANPDDLHLGQELAYALDQSGQKEQAAAVYQRLLQKAPSADKTRALYAENLAQQGKAQEALAVLQDGIKAAPTTPHLQRQLGSVLERSGRRAEAAAAYRAYARLAPNAPDARAMAERAAALEGTGGRP
jgi:Flp pilus assembly protein TadD